MVKIKFNGSNVEYNVIFRKKSEHIISLTGDIPQNTSGFKAYSGDVLLGDYSDYITIYRTFTGGIEFSNNGSTEPDKTVTITATFDGGETHIPNSISITTNKGADTLKKNQNWTKTFTVKESDDVTIVAAEDLEHFIKAVSPKNVNYKYISPVPSNEQRIIDLEAAVCELYEMLGE